MMNRFYLLVTVFITSTITVHSQSLLDRNVSLEVNRQRLDHVLEIVSNKANFYFSYNSNIIRSDSLVSLSVRNQPVRQVLRQLLPDHYEFRESGQYLIIRKTPITLTMKTGRAVTRDPYYTISGHVLDDETGAWIRNASIYEKSQLASVLTNGDGFFRSGFGTRAMLPPFLLVRNFTRIPVFLLMPVITSSTPSPCYQ